MKLFFLLFLAAAMAGGCASNQPCCSGDQTGQGDALLREQIARMEAHDAELTNAIRHIRVAEFEAGANSGAQAALEQQPPATVRTNLDNQLLLRRCLQLRATNYPAFPKIVPDVAREKREMPLKKNLN